MTPLGDDHSDSSSELIDPESEPQTGLVSVASARSEENFFSAAALAHKLEQNKLNLGLLGKLFGANISAPTNIAGLVVVASLIGIGLTFLSSSTDALEMRKLLVGLVSSALAFIFGAASKK